MILFSKLFDCYIWCRLGWPCMLAHCVSLLANAICQKVPELWHLLPDSTQSDGCSPFFQVQAILCISIDGTFQLIKLLQLQSHVFTLLHSDFLNFLCYCLIDIPNRLPRYQYFCVIFVPLCCHLDQFILRKGYVLSQLVDDLLTPLQLLTQFRNFVFVHAN